jgi:hypothetical protein
MLVAIAKFNACERSIGLQVFLLGVVRAHI